DLYRAYFRQVRAIIAQSEPSERVVLASLQLVPLDTPAPRHGAARKRAVGAKSARCPTGTPADPIFVGPRPRTSITAEQEMAPPGRWTLLSVAAGIALALIPVLRSLRSADP